MSVAAESSWTACPEILLHKTPQKRPMYKGNQKIPCLFKYHKWGKGHSKIRIFPDEASQFSYLWQFFFILWNDLYENLMTWTPAEVQKRSHPYFKYSRSLEKGNVPVNKHWPSENHSSDFCDILGIIMNNKQILSEIKEMVMPYFGLS